MQIILKNYINSIQFGQIRLNRLSNTSPKADYESVTNFEPIPCF